MKEITATIISQSGTCYCNHEIGDKFVIGERTPDGMCAWAYYTIFPYAQTLKFGGAFPWEKDSTKAVLVCPDAQNPVVFELTAGATEQY
ncbi:MAG: TIGR04076 family protein [Chloroflexi bacterium]|nr:TIGR04076 family protein [Chloroflexota bacterium]